MEWKNWHEDHDVEVKIGSAKKSIQGTPAVVAWKKGLLHVFVRGAGTDTSIYHGTYNDSASTKWTWEALAATQPAGGLTSIAATSWGDDRIDLFARGTTNKKIYHCAWLGPYKWETQWKAVLDGATDYAPAASSWGDGRLDVFVHTLDHHTSNLNYAGSAWSKEWLNVGGYGATLDGAPASAASGPKRVDLFARETSSRKHLLHSFYDGTEYDKADAAKQKTFAWVNPDESKASGAMKDESQTIAGDVAACSSPLGDGRVDVFACNSANRLLHREFKNDHWTNKWEDLGGTNTKHIIAGDPAAVAWYVPGIGPGTGWTRFDCFAVGANNVLKHISWP